MSETAGTIDSIWRFPIKSFQGESIESTMLTGAGITGDRQYALRDPGTDKILSAKNPRLGDQLLEMSAVFVSEPIAGAPVPEIIATIAGTAHSTAEPDELSRSCSAALGVDVVLSGEVAAATYESYWPENEGLTLSDIEIDLAIPEIGSFADLEPLHIITTSSLHHLAELLPDSEIVVGRFRPSLVIDTGDTTGFVENGWEGRSATLGGATIRFGVASPRCVMTTRPQLGLPRDRAVLQTLARENRRPFHEFGDFACLGIYATVTEPGPIAVADGLTFHDS